MLDLVASLDSTDEEDFYTVTLTAGVTYYIEAECGGYRGYASSHNLPGWHVLSLDDAFVSLYDPAAGNALIAVNDDGGQWPDARLVFTPTVTGDYVVGISAYRDTQLGTYRVKVFEDDFRGSASGGSSAGPVTGTLGALVNGGTATGVINYVGDGGTSNGDVDVFAFSVVGGLRYVIEVRGAETGDGTLVRPELRLLDSADNPLKKALSDPAGSNVQMGYTAAVNTTLFAAVEDWSIETGGSYVLALSMGMGSAAADSVNGGIASDGIAGLGGDDTIAGLLGDDTILGGLGNDRVTGDDGNDHLSGDLGADSLWGGFGNDVLQGGRQRDVLTGDFGADRFVFAAADSVAGDHDVIHESRVTDAFEIGQDRIDLSAIDGDQTIAGHQSLILDGTQGLGHVWLETRNDKTFVLAETDGTGKADFVLVIRDGLVDHSAYGAGDFVL